GGTLDEAQAKAHALLEQVLRQQSSVVAFEKVFLIMGITFTLALPLLLLLRTGRARGGGGPAHYGGTRFRRFPGSSVAFRLDLPAYGSLRFSPAGPAGAPRGRRGHPQQRARASGAPGARREHGTHAHVRRAGNGDVRPDRDHLAVPQRSG